MNKEYMIAAVVHRLKELEHEYIMACKDMSASGKKLTRSGSACLRSRLKRDICTLKLIKELLDTSSAVYIMDCDAADGFDRLIKGTC